MRAYHLRVHPIVDTDRTDTWPPEALDWVQSIGPHEAPDEVALDDDEESFRDLFEGYLVRAYHATRLLEHEVAAIREQGLRLLTPALAKDRIEAAREHGYLSDPEADRLLETHVAGAKNRAGQVCLFFDDEVMRDPWSGIWRLLTTWGGEAIYWRNERDEATLQKLRSLGQPAIVVAGLDVTRDTGHHLFTPDLRRTFLAKYLRFGIKTGLHYRVPIPADHIEDIWMPGHPDFESRQTLTEAAARATA